MYSRTLPTPSGARRVGRNLQAQPPMQLQSDQCGEVRLRQWQWKVCYCKYANRYNIRLFVCMYMFNANACQCHTGHPLRHSFTFRPHHKLQQFATHETKLSTLPLRLLTPVIRTVRSGNYAKRCKATTTTTTRVIEKLLNLCVGVGMACTVGWWKTHWASRDSVQRSVCVCVHHSVAKSKSQMQINQSKMSFVVGHDLQ